MKVDGEEIDYSGLPASYRDAMRLYIEHGIDPGTGWHLILANHLSAVTYCDDQTVRDLPVIWRWIHNHAPSQCHGSGRIVKEWMETKYAERNAHVHPAMIPVLQPIARRCVPLTAPEMVGEGN